MLEVIHKDAEFLVVNKPTRMLTVPGKGPDKQDCLYHRLREEFPELLVVHRLDMDTSGLLLFACTPEAQRNLSMQFEQREVHKTYIAVVEGSIEAEQGKIDAPMRKDMTQSLPPRHIIDHIQGKPAVTRWNVLERNSTNTRLELTPETGRSHQLRLHLQSVGHPIVGDPIYGRPSDRLMLHAASIEFRHPVTGELIHLTSLPPF